MKIVVAALLIGFSVSQLACQKPDEAENGKPAITSISFLGIPPQNVRFDVPNARIMVQLPAILPRGLQPIFELTEGARVIDEVMADNTIDLTRFCYCGISTNSAQDKEITLRIGNKTTTSVYKLNVIATGVLKPQDSAEQLTFSRKTKLLEMSLPVENLYSNPTMTDRCLPT